ncbi:BZ3500_MvSof-1268-A1-R1_Chr4-2g07074 [Microbotryum saponariae]|uniref:BZ3500_MvSof-1268-A1-R1_Chr4-2g07074 protein n=1 Tax=Microbotryum saponariae TaxID=289078 RepID=A0A2X0LLC4_9BASI|nr:BZ3500_MvSof-1268-A1-R1_Chr4-2g07074 [Microbotryum saponariae]SDA06739.1 BZ3501_MvSof-1269-A2-R1_Chr4-2g06785 [Microbotryum saponariae]
MSFGNTSTPFAEPAWESSLHFTPYASYTNPTSSPYYSEKHVKLRAFMRQHIERLMPNAAEWEQLGQVPEALATERAKAGLTAASIYPLPGAQDLDGIKLPAGLERSEWDPFCDLIMSDEGARLGYLGVAWALGGGNAIGAPPLVAYGTTAQRQKFLRPILRGEKRICLGVTEASGGSDVAAIKTTATRVEGGWRVTGSKKWITNAIFSDYMMTAVRTGDEGNKGLSFMIIDLHADGVTKRSIENTGVKASGSSYVELDEVFVPDFNLIGKEGDGFRMVMVMVNFLHVKCFTERFLLAVQANRMSRVCLEDAYEYATKRHTFGKPLISSPIIRAKISDMALIITANHSWIEALAFQLSVLPKVVADVELTGQAALLKVACTRGLERCNREALQILGGIGYQRGGIGGRVEQISRDLRVMCIGGGSDEIMSSLGLRQAEAVISKNEQRLSFKAKL